MAHTKYAASKLTVTAALTAGDVARTRRAATALTVTAKMSSEPRDFTDVTQFLLTGRVSAIVADTDDSYNDADLYNLWVNVTITARPEVVYLTSTATPRILRLRPVQARIESSVLRLPGGVDTEGVRLVAKTAVLGLGLKPLLYDVKFGKANINSVQVDYSDLNFTFEAPTTDTTVDLTTVARV